MSPYEVFMVRLSERTMDWRDVEYLARLLAKVRISDEGCWIWTGMVSTRGYGVASVPRRGNEKSVKTKSAHRVLWQLLHDEPLGELTLDHLCQVKLCVNPEHLDPVTLEENVRRGWKRENVERRNRNRDKNACPLGHPYTEENIYRRTNGARVCRACVRERQARRRETEPERLKEIKRLSYHRNKGDRLPPTSERTHCPRGHPYDEENTYILPKSGGRVCRICARERQRPTPRSVGR